VDDLKISHVNPNAVTEVIQLLEEEFGKEAPLTKMRGKAHDYLGMTLNFSSPGQAKILMMDYIENMLEEMPSDMDGEAPTPASDHLFQVNEKDPVMLDDDTATMFHHNVATILRFGILPHSTNYTYASINFISSPSVRYLRTRFFVRFCSTADHDQAFYSL
jgi:hypothetical protein